MCAHDHHADKEFHHHHSHWEGNIHQRGHHLLQVEGLSVSFRMYEPSTTMRDFLVAKRVTSSAIEDLSLSVHKGEIVAVVGASGSGKTLLADAILGMFEPNATVEGSIWFDGKLQDADSLAKLRGRQIAFIPQSISALDPLMRVGRQILGTSRDEGRLDELLERYHLGPEVKGMYPFELSGGMARRVLLCCALMGSPKLMIADEPTPGMDLDLAMSAMQDLRDFADAGGGVLLITHDIELALKAANRIAVFKDGTIVEETSVESFDDPNRLEHPFSRELWHALPNNDWIASC